MGRSRYSMSKILSGPELAAKGYMDLQDRGGVMSSKCSFCGHKGGPMAAMPVMADPTGRLRGHLIRTQCQACAKAGRK